MTPCYFQRETVQNDNSLTYDCKLLEEMQCEGCKWRKTYEQYNPRKVEQDMKQYAERMGEG